MDTQNRISLSHVKICKFASEETLCFQARVLLDGQYFADAKNDGHGGSTFIFPAGGRMNKVACRQMDEAEEFCKTLPDDVTEWDDPTTPGVKFAIKQDLEHVVDHLAATYEFERAVRADFNRSIKSKVLWVKDGALWELKGCKDAAKRTAWSNSVAAKHPDAMVLNLQPEQAAFAIYRAHMEKHS